MVDFPQESLSLKQLIRGVQRELAESEQERESRGEDALFEVEKLTLEVNFVVTQNVKGGFNFKVLSFGGVDVGGGIAEQQVHKITLSLNAIKEDLHPVANTISRSFGRLPKGARPAPQVK